MLFIVLVSLLKLIYYKANITINLIILHFLFIIAVKLLIYLINQKKFEYLYQEFLIKEYL